MSRRSPAAPATLARRRPDAPSESGASGARAAELESARAAALESARAAELESARAAEPAAVGLVAARLLGLTNGGARVAIADREVDATVDAAVDPRVLATALARGERVIVQREAGAWVVLGTLRTAATLGVDEGDFVVRAGRLRVVVGHAFEVIGGTASLVVRATGHVETLAEEITARASGVQRLVARMLRLN